MISKQTLLDDYDVISKKIKKTESHKVKSGLIAMKVIISKAINNYPNFF